MHWIIAAILTPIPIIHLWLHALLPLRRGHPAFFYFGCFLLWVASFWWFPRIAELSPQLFFPGEIIQWVGILLMFIGVVAVFGSIITLGIKRFFLWAVLRPVQANNIRIMYGPFRWFPHPAYLGYLLIALGNFLLNGKLYLMIVFLFLLSLMPVVILFEEGELRERLNFETKNKVFSNQDIIF